jgi:metal transporter CNNM
MGKDQISMAYHLIPLARFVIILTWPISYPFSKLLDTYFLENEEKSAFKRGELSALVRIQYEERMAWKQKNEMKNHTDLSTLESYAADKEQPLLSRCHDMLEHLEFLSSDRGACAAVEAPCRAQDIHECESIDHDDLRKVEGVLTLKNKTVANSFTRMHRVFAIPSDTILDEAKVVEIYNKGYSRIPVYDPSHSNSLLDGAITNIRGILLTKQLLVIDKTVQRKVSTLHLYRPPCLSPDTSMADAMNLLQAGGRTASHMAIVCIWPEVANAALDRNEAIPMEAGVVGIITLENVIEELIQEQIHDEKDRKEKGPLERARWAIAKWKAFALKKRSDREDEGISKTQVGGIMV